MVRTRIFAIVLFALSLLPLACKKEAQPLKPQQGLNPNELAFLKQVNGNKVQAHLAQLQRIAEQNQGNRAAGTQGHEDSLNYIADQLTAAGYEVQFQAFDFVSFTKDAASFRQMNPNPINYRDEEDFNVMTFSGSGNVAADVVAVDIALGPGNQSNSACEASDFEHFPAGRIALIQRGTCPFSDKVANAERAGASAVVIFNQGDSETRKDLFGGTLSSETPASIPVFSISYTLAEAFLSTDGLILELNASTRTETKTTSNLITESKVGNPNNIVMLGAHLDSVPAGPGINDNGSGSAAILEVALQSTKLNPQNKLRFAWWSAEELGLVGSKKYVEMLNDEEKSRIALYLNFDMIASPNYYLGVYDSDGSEDGNMGPAGSGAIESMTQRFFALNGLKTQPAAANGRSDYAPFADAGIPFGGVFTGAEGTKSPEEAKLYGGESGKAYDACYHQACDNLNNISAAALELNVDAIAYLVYQYARSTADVDKQKEEARKSKTGPGFMQFNPKLAHIHHESPHHLGCREDLLVR